jgi:SAM-dependent methyltransferase
MSGNFIAHLYGQNFYRKHEPWRQAYVDAAGVLDSALPFSSALDLGCGNAYILEELHNRGKQVFGVEGSLCAIDFIAEQLRPHVLNHDLTTPIALGHYDLVICTEVAEHLESIYAGMLVKSICAHTPNFVFFTAATPGQGGRFHHNEQPYEYWLEKFRDNGYEHDVTKSTLVKTSLSSVMRDARWIARNTMIFEPISR